MMKIGKKMKRFVGWSAVSLLLLLLGCMLLPRLFHLRAEAVASGSMEPTFPVGALIFVQQAAPEDIMDQDCITYRKDDVTITHRVVAIDADNRVFITKGDANQHADAPVPFESLIGRASVHCLPAAGYVVMWLAKINAGFLAWMLFAILVLIIVIDRVFKPLVMRRNQYET